MHHFFSTIAQTLLTILLRSIICQLFAVKLYLAVTTARCFQRLFIVLTFISLIQNFEINCEAEPQSSLNVAKIQR